MPDQFGNSDADLERGDNEYSRAKEDGHLKEAKITREEMIEMFGETMPIEAAELLWDAPDHWTVGMVRAELRQLAKDRAKK